MTFRTIVIISFVLASNILCVLNPRPAIPCDIISSIIMLYFYNAVLLQLLIALCGHVFQNNCLFSSFSIDFVFQFLLFPSVKDGFVFCVPLRLPSRRGSLAWWKRPTSWAYYAIVRSLSSFSTALTSFSSTPAQTWTKFCWNTQSIMNHTRAEPTQTS